MTEAANLADLNARNVDAATLRTWRVSDDPEVRDIARIEIRRRGRLTRDLCQDCWQEVHPTEYAPLADRDDLCDACKLPALVARSLIAEEVTTTPVAR